MKDYRDKSIINKPNKNEILAMKIMYKVWDNKLYKILFNL